MTFVDPAVSLLMIAEDFRRANPQSSVADKLDRLAGNVKALRAREGRPLKLATPDDRTNVERMVAELGIRHALGEMARTIEILADRNNVQAWNVISENLLAIANRLA